MVSRESPESFSCSVCLQDVGEGEGSFTLTCKHRFHASCIYTWLKINDKCPICRKVDPFIDLNIVKNEEEGREAMMNARNILLREEEQANPNEMSFERGFNSSVVLSDEDW